MRTWRWYSKVLFAILAAAFAYYVWPTPWHYFDGYPGIHERRVHRVTERAQILYPGGWQPYER